MVGNRVAGGRLRESVDPRRMERHHAELAQKVRWRKCISTKVSQMIKSAKRSAGLLHKISQPTAWRGGAQILVNEEEDARLLDSCEAKRKNGQSTGSVMRRCRMWWRSLVRMRSLGKSVQSV